ncbi:hypothetical protein VTH06DRAFT_5314 [Thermothelomyces fergusii]
MISSWRNSLDTVDVRLSDTVANQIPTSFSGRSRPGYQYCIWPDNKTSSIWCQADWEGNLAGETHVGKADLKERYGDAWERAREAWVNKYTRAFEGHECHLHSSGGPIFSPKEQKAWIIEGVPLAAWLALRPGIDNVEFWNRAGARIGLLEKKSLGATLAPFLERLEGKEWN